MNRLLVCKRGRSEPVTANICDGSEKSKESDG